MKKARPFLKWAGNKFNCIQHITDALPPGQRLIEPFAGSAAVFVNANFPRFLVAEGNQDLIQLYQCLKDEGKDFINYCGQWFCPENNQKQRYLALREEFNGCQHNRLRAALFLYLNRHGYNGLCRYNSSGVYNVPFGQYTKPYFPLKEMQHFYEKTPLAEFIQADFRVTFEIATIGDVIYCDPPYAPRLQASNFTAYTHQKFGQIEHEELAELAQSAANRGIPVLISNHDTKLTRNLYQAADIQSFKVSRFINSKSDNRRPVRELLAIFRPPK